ncbi:dimethylarginine dimethylaminohydrolase family protein [Pseudolabrys sp.]|uniref:dimethylarginine dimethylaminohydrolase family protein n=1 Tax=Pseudolabrys sp. TaxID=1960880 RepID=UPI003D098E98
MDELPKIWGKRWGAQSEIGHLRSVMVSRPSDNEASPEVRDDPHFFATQGSFPNLELMRRQHKELVKVLVDFGSEVVYFDPPAETIGPYGRLRMLWAPASAFVINGGAIIPRYGLAPWRRGFEALLARKLGELGCPILCTIHGDGVFELGGNCQWLDPRHLVIGVGKTTNMEGVRQVWSVFKDSGVEDIHLTTFKNVIHLDMAFGMASDWVAVVDPRCLEPPFLAYLRRKGIELVEVDPAEADNSACNTLVLKPGVVVLPAGNPKTAKALRERNIEVIEIDMSEFVKTGGGPHCATAGLVRDPGPLLTR